MSLWRQLTRGLRVLTRRTEADQDVADEVEQYLEQAAAEQEANGLTPADARRAARVELGSVLAVREQVRDYGWENAVETLLSDLRHGLRQLRRRPGFAGASILTLALGIGAATAIFSTVNPILFEPLPYPNASRLMMVRDTARDGARIDVTFGTYRELVERSRSFESLAVMRTWQPTATGALEPERLDGQRVSAPYFRLLGVSPFLGRDFHATDDQLNAPKVAMISESLWRRRFGGDRAVVGREIALDDRRYTIVGVMPGAFENVLAPPAEIWTPLQYDLALPPEGREWGHHLRMVGRLRSGVAADRARRELDAIARAPIADFQRPRWASLENGLFVSSLQDDLTRDVKPALLAILGAVILLLAIACVNVTNLLLARGAERRPELAMRTALGAPRSRLMRQLLTESLLLAVLGGALGVALAHAGVRALVALSPAGLPRTNAIAIDTPVFLFAFALTTFIGILVGLVPARHASRGGMQQSSPRVAGSHHSTRRTLVIVEVALALVLLVGAGLLLRSLRHLFAVPPGFDPTHLVTMQVQTSGQRFNDDGVTHRFFNEALEAVRAVPGVSSAAFTSQLPLSGDADSYGVHFESSPTQRADEDRSATRYGVSPGYFETMGIALRRGRLLNAHDRAGAPLAAVLNESFAKRRFPGLDPIGQRLHVGRDDGPWFTIVGVVGDVKHTSLALSQSDAVYTTAEQWDFADSPRWLVVQTRAGASLAPLIRRAIWSVDKDQPVTRVATMEERVAASISERRFALILFEAFAAVALALAAIGIYGVLSGSVTERTRELGIRAALGASRRSLLALVFRQGMTLTGAGVVVGLIAAVAASRALAALLFGVSRLDVITYAGVILLLAAVSAIACSLPAWRAARVAPSITLRSE